MRVLVLVAFAFTLSACAGVGASGPNGWGAPRSASAERPARAERPAPRAEAPHASRPVRPSPRFEAAPDRRAETASGFMIPVAGIEGGSLRDSFNAPRSGGRTHHAIDIAAPTGTPLVAVADGEIVRKHWNRLGGRTLYLRSADGRYDFYYAHLDAYADGLEIGSRVRRGDVIGTVGATGNAQGPHLHFQVLDLRGGGRGTPVNPFDMFRTAELALVD